MSDWKVKLVEKLFDVTLVEALFYLALIIIALVVGGDLMGWDVTGSLHRAATAAERFFTSMGCAIQPQQCR